jgi:hypothetical protein
VEDSHGWEDNIKMYFKETDWGGVGRINMGLDRDW